MIGKTCIPAGIVLMALVCCAPLPASEGPTAQEVKAACLYYFATFVEWPSEAFPDPSSPLRIGVIDRGSMAEVVTATVSGKTVKGRPVVVERLSDDDFPRTCHLVYVEVSGQRRSKQILEQLGAGNALTVGESKEFTRAGGVIQFYMDKDTVRFEINLEAAERAGLSISSQLLKLARITPAGEEQ